MNFILQDATKKEEERKRREAFSRVSSSFYHQCVSVQNKMTAYLHNYTTPKPEREIYNYMFR